MRSSTSAADDNITIADTQALDEMLERSELGSVMGSDTYSMPGSLHVRKELDRGVTPGQYARITACQEGARQGGHSRSVCPGHYMSGRSLKGGLLLVGIIHFSSLCGTLDIDAYPRELKQI